MKNIVIRELEGNGDFRSDECIEYLKQADVVVTNPPFSLFRQYVKQLMDYGKKFIIVGNFNAITYKEIFPYIKNNELWLGVSPRSMSFKLPNNEYSCVNACWYTNIEHSKRNETLDLYKRYNEREFPKYDNYDAIECGKVSEIPMDYEGVIGVPITFLYKYCPTQFEIVGITENADYLNSLYIKGFEKYDRGYINGKRMYSRLLIKKVSA